MKLQTWMALALGCLVWGGLAIAQDKSPKGMEPKGSQPEPAKVVAYAGSLAHTETELRKVAEEQDITQAAEFAKQLLAPRGVDRAQAWLERHTGKLGARASAWARGVLPALGFELRTSDQQALVHYALGCLQSEQGMREEAQASFETTTFMTPGPARLDATYNLGCLDLQAGEILFDKIPEVHGRTRSAMSPGFMPGQKGLNPDEEEPDYLKLARASYTAALEDFTERLKLDWRDADTRANVEWIMGRMDELDRIEEERKSDEGQGQAQDDPSAGEGEQEENKSDAGEKGADSKEEQEPQDQQDSQEKSEQDESKEQGQTQDRQEESADDNSSQKQGEPEGEPETKPEERILTEEEIKRLLEQLKKHDAAGVDMRKRVESRQRNRSKKDW